MNRSEQVQAVKYISKEKAQALYLERNSEDATLLDGVDIVGNVFPASFEIELHDLSENQDVIAIATSEKYKEVIEEFDFERLDVVNTIGNAQKFITRAGITAAGIFGLISVMVIFNTIRMAIFTRSNEIQIMKLIGATNNYIRGPFLVESSFYGVIAGVLALLVVYPFVTQLLPSLESPIVFTKTAQYFSENALLIVSATIGIGVFIGVASSLFAMSRYLRLQN